MFLFYEDLSGGVTFVSLMCISPGSILPRGSFFIGIILREGYREIAERICSIDISTIKTYSIRIRHCFGDFVV